MLFSLTPIPNRRVSTAHGNQDISAEALPRGAVAFLRKPFSQDSLLDAVRLVGEIISDYRTHHCCAVRFSDEVNSIINIEAAKKRIRQQH